ncbi:peptidoglycan DD-metalloendopeptidase family protein [Haliovirga abyssi]|uniref:LysM domain-containing protein n=1 Tax=Haliovirga abyssi TaxID=2996794 RepID=A0AAU9E1D1_9FUSO|nr:M23 family metallopeptidase [Haliovirga abyssi]BDU50175.1 hypothetical protein HLVA_07440 [Haliovirga abyssi]
MATNLSKRKIIKIFVYIMLFFSTVFILTIVKGNYQESGNGTDAITKGDISKINSENAGIQIIDYQYYTFEKDYSDVVNNLETDKKENENKKLKEIYYTVKRGDTLHGISQAVGQDMNIIVANNPKVKNGKIYAGQKLKILNKDGIYYTVKSRDTLGKISNKYKVKLASILEANNLNDTQIKKGEKIFIPNPNLDFVIKANRTRYAKKTFSNRTKFGWPVRYRGVTSPFGNRYHPVLKRYIFHTGVDLRARTGTALYSALDGKVTYSGWMSGYGRIVIIKHSKGYSTRYAHLSKSYVKVGQYVKKGQQIGKTGKTGRVTGPHLHFEIRKYGKPLNPMRFLKR